MDKQRQPKLLAMLLIILVVSAITLLLNRIAV